MHQSARPNGSVGNSRRFRLETGFELLDSRRDRFSGWWANPSSSRARDAFRSA